MGRRTYLENEEAIIPKIETFGFEQLVHCFFSGSSIVYIVRGDVLSGDGARDYETAVGNWHITIGIVLWQVKRSLNWEYKPNQAKPNKKNPNQSQRNQKRNFSNHS